ncbi:hypothetical protein [Flavobacterium caeni]|uniref:Uncharacterized protein n=1 Tax=Flavobacterium caeni TaxID=490189 RepID=A0A1G5KGM3_9FLAO|nr:hypothetical protein [Flavobacterium caeni]SCY99717.1 hypothetical protein SAMN02927903_03296 [Flavobacterium caeni]
MTKKRTPNRRFIDIAEISVSWTFVFHEESSILAENTQSALSATS